MIDGKRMSELDYMPALYFDVVDDYSLALDVMYMRNTFETLVFPSHHPCMRL